MKNLSKYILTVLLFVGFTACDSSFLDREDPDLFNVSKYYKTEKDMEDALTGAYGATRSFYNWMYFSTEMKSDNASTTNTGDNGGLYATFTNHLVTSSNTIVSSIWDGLYLCIYRSNLILKYIDDVPMGDESRARITAEAKFLRALSHFYLIRLYGPVPKIDRVLETVTETKQLTRLPLTDVYEFIIADLKEVTECEDLATFESGDRLGHATRTAGAALLGKVYLTMAATLGENSYYSDAITYLTKACDLHNMKELPTAFNSIFGSANTNNAEIIFQCMYLPVSGEYSSFASDFGPYNVTNLTSQAKGRGFNSGEKNLFDSFESGDRRRAVTMAATADGFSYYTKKYVDLSNANGYGGNSWIELRFADVFLMLAEAYEQTNDKPNAIKFLDLVRTKHGALKGYEETRLNNSDYAAKYPTLRDAIFHERRSELAFENHRWFDLLRLYPKAEDLTSYMKSISNNIKYKGFLDKESLLPIPYDEVIFNPNIYQNKDY